MKQIPLIRRGNALFLFGKINGSLNIEFLLDTGCSGTLLAKEVGDILFLKGNLTESDVKGTSTSYYGGIYIFQLDFAKRQTANVDIFLLSGI